MDTDKVVIDGVSEDSELVIKAEAKSPLMKVLKLIIGTVMFVLRSILSAIESVVNAFSTVLSKLDFKSKLAFFFIIILIIVITFLIGFNLGRSDKEREFKEEIGLNDRELKELKDFLDARD